MLPLSFAHIHHPVHGDVKRPRLQAIAVGPRVDSGWRQKKAEIRDASIVARRHPELIKTLSLIGVPVQGPKEAEWLALVEKDGVRAWAAATMDARLAGMSRAMKGWWIDLMAATPRSTMLGFLRFVSSIDVREDLPRLHCPVLVVTSDSPRRPIATVVEWQRKIPSSRLVMVPGDGYHAAATEPDACAGAVAAFIAERSRQRGG